MSPPTSGTPSRCSSMDCRSTSVLTNERQWLHRREQHTVYWGMCLPQIQISHVWEYEARHGLCEQRPTTITLLIKGKTTTTTTTTKTFDNNDTTKSRAHNTRAKLLCKYTRQCQKHQNTTTSNKHMSMFKLCSQYSIITQFSGSQLNNHTE